MYEPSKTFGVIHFSKRSQEPTLTPLTLTSPYGQAIAPVPNVTRTTANNSFPMLLQFFKGTEMHWRGWLGCGPILCQGWHLLMPICVNCLMYNSDMITWKFRHCYCYVILMDDIIRTFVRTCTLIPPAHNIISIPCTIICNT